MKSIHIGLTSSNLSSLLHKNVYISGDKGINITGFLLNKEQIFSSRFDKPLFLRFFPNQCQVEAKDSLLIISNSKQNALQLQAESYSPTKRPEKLLSVFLVKPVSGNLSVSTSGNVTSPKSYSGQLIIIAEDNKIRLILKYPLEDYVQSVLRGEVPSSYHLEAIKAQAVCARSYALRPRVNHLNDFCDVCDSYQCCQCFTGIPEKKGSVYLIACYETTGQVLTYNDKPALALFSSCAGGHTENYEDCFSDYATRAFPPERIPYLKGVSEDLKENPLFDERYLRSLWHMPKPSTIDAWGRNFRWSITLSNQELESHIHSNIATLIEQGDFAPFIIPPKSGVFGEILAFKIAKRGIGGTAIDLVVQTSKGNWKFVKELTIRSLFKNVVVNFKRLSSARIFFNEVRDDKERLLDLQIYGLGAGHGVGLQQVGAEGLARQNKTYQEILRHYYRDIDLSKI